MSRDFTLDVRLEPDELELDWLAEKLRATDATRVKVRHEQYRALARDCSRIAFADAVERPSAVFGVPIMVEEDGLTARERSIKRAEREFPPTRQQQVEAVLAKEREQRRELDRLREELVGLHDAIGNMTVAEVTEGPGTLSWLKNRSGLSAEERYRMSLDFGLGSRSAGVITNLTS